MTSDHAHRCFRITAAAALLTVAFGVPGQAQMPASLDGTAEFPAETAAIVAATARLFDAAEGRALPVISGPVIATPASAGVQETKAGILTSHGPVDHLTGYRISWYPVDRFLGSVDFMGTWDGNRNLVCGFVTWDLSDPAAPVLEDVTASFLEVSELAEGSDEDIHATLLEANCAYGAIDANYALFE